MLLPHWFADRLGDDVWFFGLLLSTGQMLAVETLKNVTQDIHGDTWLEVDLLESGALSGKSALGSTLVFAPTSRKTANISLRHVVAVVELADT
jgi:hypothetical protein